MAPIVMFKMFRVKDLGFSLGFGVKGFCPTMFRLSVRLQKLWLQALQEADG